MAERLASVRAPLLPAIAACASGEIPANVAAMRLLIHASSPGEAEAALALAAANTDPLHREAKARLQSAFDLLRSHPDAFGTVRLVMAEAEHDRPPGSEDEGIAHWAGVFDRLARVSPEAGVALYSLGSTDLLDAATAEIVTGFREWRLLGPEAHVLEVGCGVGRFVAALAPEVAAVTGTDVSPVMIEEARKRCGGLANVRLQPCSGRDLADFEDASFDLVLAADVFPYLVQAGGELACRHIVEAARVLRPIGTLAILNYSYRGNLELDTHDIAAQSRRAGFAVVAEPDPEFRFWDGSVFLLRKA